MLVLSRKEGESLHIGSNISVTVTKCARGRVSIGINAPQEIRVLRGEIADAYPDKALGSTQPKRSTSPR